MRVLGAAAVPLVLVFIQPDIGTSIVLAAIVVGMLIVAGTRLEAPRCSSPSSGWC